MSFGTAQQKMLVKVFLKIKKGQKVEQMSKSENHTGIAKHLLKMFFKRCTVFTENMSRAKKY